MNGFIVGAIVLFGISSLLTVGFVNTTRRQKRLYLTESLSAGTLTALHKAATDAAGPNSFARMVDVSGVAAAGPSGLLTAELSRKPCVWHSHVVLRRYVETVTDAQGKDSRQTREETVSELRPETPFTVRGADGTVLVVPTVAVDSAEKVLDEFKEDVAGSGTGTVRREWLLAEGTQIFVHGEAADRDGQLAIREPDGADKLEITTRTEAQVLTGMRKSSRFLLIAMAVIDLVGVALLVVGLSR